MSKASDNKKARRKRNKRMIQQIARKKMSPCIYQREGVNSDYYDVVFASIKVKKNSHGRLMQVKAGVRPNAKYYALMEKLVKLCGDMRVEIPKEMLGDTE
jgi:hypothetical protein